MDTVALFYWDHSYNMTLLVNLAICIGLFTSLRLFSGAIAHVSAWDELVKKDNPAFGISLAGVAFAVTIVLVGALYGKPANNLYDSVIAVGGYGIIGIILMALTRIIFDRIALPRISIRDEIEKSNMAAGIIDAGNVIATAIVIQAVTMWVEVNTVEGIQALLVGYVASQILLTLATFIRVKIYSIRNHGSSIQEAFKQGNAALALLFAGRRIGTAFAITAAANIMVYEIYDIYQLLVAWMGISVIMVAALAVLSFIADKIILFRIDVNHEVTKERNVAIGALQGVVYMSLGLLLAQLVV